MCLAMPMKIKTVSGQVADCEAGGLTQQIRVDFGKSPAFGGN